MRMMIYGLTLGVFFIFARVPALAALIDSTAKLENPSFESPTLTLIAGTKLDGCDYQQALATSWSGGWTEVGTTSNSLRHYRPHTSGLKSNGGYFWDPTDGVNGAAIILRSDPVITTGWQYQSLGTVTSEDIGRLFAASIDSSVRYSTSAYSAEQRISFRIDVTSGRNGQFGELVSMDLPSAARTAGSDNPWHTLVEWFRPTEEHLGKEIFLVFSAFRDPATNGQFQFDNVQLWVVPEPSTLGISVIGLGALLGWIGWRRQRSGWRRVERCSKAAREGSRP